MNSRKEAKQEPLLHKQAYNLYRCRIPHAELPNHHQSQEIFAFAFAFASAFAFTFTFTSVFAFASASIFAFANANQSIN